MSLDLKKNMPKTLMGIMVQLFVLCNTLVERIAYVEEDVLAQFGVNKGDSIYVEDPLFIQKVEAQLTDVEMASGGSGANTAHGAANLGMPVVFAGTIGHDSYGDFFHQCFLDVGVRPHFDIKPAYNGVVYILITPDKQRSFIVVPSVSYNYAQEKLPLDTLKASSFFHSTAYALSFRSQVAERAYLEAKLHGIRTSLDLSSPLTILQNRDRIDRVLEHVDVLFISKEEAAALGYNDSTIIDALQGRYHIPLIFYKQGKDGVIVGEHGQRTHIPAFRANVKSETGAGDAFAAGVLCGLSKNLSSVESAKIGAYYAAKVVEHTPSRLPHKLTFAEIQQALAQVLEEV